MGQGVKRTQRDYSLTFKLALVEQIEKGELTYKQAQARYGIQGRSTVLVWLRKHGRQDWSQGASVRAGRSITMPDPDNQTPEQRIKELEQQLALMSQKAQFFEAVVDVLKNDYGVSWLITSCRSANNIMPITIFLPAGTASFFYSA